MTTTELLVRIAVAIVMLGIPIWLIVRLVDRIEPKEPDELDHTV